MWFDHISYHKKVKPQHLQFIVSSQVAFLQKSEIVVLLDRDTTEM